MIPWSAILVTVKLATLTTVILTVAGLPFAYWLATTRWRGRFLLDAVVALPIILPPTVIGFYLLMALGPRTGFGSWLESLLGHPVPFSFTGILIGSVLFNLPFAIRPFTAAFAAVNRRYVESSWCLGVSRSATFFRVTLPLARAGILAGAILVFAHTIGEFGVVLMLGGNIPGLTQTISTVIYDDIQSLNYAGASVTSALLLAFAGGVLSLVYALQKRVLPIV